MATPDEIFSIIDEQDIRFINLWYTDITGRVKSVTVPPAQLQRIIDKGAHFDGSSLEGFARVAESDMLLLPDLDTFAVLPWTANDEKAARIICNVYTTSGDPFIGDPRAALIRMLNAAREMGFTYKTGMELEFFLFENQPNDQDSKPLIPHDTHSYYDMPGDEAQRVRNRMIAVLEQMGIRVLSAHHENGSGQQEIDLLFGDALHSADRILTARVAMKAIARQHGLHCTFMPRPSANLPGSGMHTHQSLHDAETGGNVFYDADSQYGLSKVAEQFLAGQLAYARAMSAVLAPLVNSYKRLGTSFEAPVYVTWAHINRGALIRVPGIQPGQEDHTRLELRLPDPSSNPYLLGAVMLQAGLEGIRQQFDLPSPLEETLLHQNRSRLRHMETLPNSLRQALDALEQSEVILGALGPYISDRYVAAKRQEYSEYADQVTPWELKRYFSQY
jgi:glutamine synthetase